MVILSKRRASKRAKRRAMYTNFVMAGLVPAIHVLVESGSAKKDVDARHKAGHDGVRGSSRAQDRHASRSACRTDHPSSDSLNE